MNKDRPPDHLDLNELREWLRPRLEESGGVECPVCRQHAQAYRRKITKSMVTTMGRMLVAQRRGAGHDGCWVHLPEIKQDSRDSTMLAYWHLIEEQSTVRPDGGRAGWWRVTAEGVGFLRGEIRVYRYAHVYRGRVVAYGGDQITVADVAPKFNYRDLMEGV